MLSIRMRFHTFFQNDRIDIQTSRVKATACQRTRASLITAIRNKRSETILGIGRFSSARAFVKAAAICANSAYSRPLGTSRLTGEVKAWDLAQFVGQERPHRTVGIGFLVDHYLTPFLDGFYIASFSKSSESINSNECLCKQRKDNLIHRVLGTRMAKFLNTASPIMLRRRDSCPSSVTSIDLSMRYSRNANRANIQ